MLGRPGNNVKVGIVGVPNVGKSSFFNILGKMNVPAENFPFCTIDPNVAIVPVPDQRFKWLCKKYKPASEVPPNMTITDIAGLVKVRAAKHVEEMKERVIVRTCHLPRNCSTSYVVRSVHYYCVPRELAVRR